MQCVAECGRALQCVAACVAVCCRALQYIAARFAVCAGDEELTV